MQNHLKLTKTNDHTITLDYISVMKIDSQLTLSMADNYFSNRPLLNFTLVDYYQTYVVNLPVKCV
ncbi:MAG: hypothetical protein ACJAS1_006852 [Oleiphilaceae bacterium]|jgi:hypothetical protein